MVTSQARAFFGPSLLIGAFVVLCATGIGALWETDTTPPAVKLTDCMLEVPPGGIFEPAYRIVNLRTVTSFGLTEDELTWNPRFVAMIDGEAVYLRPVDAPIVLQAFERCATPGPAR